MRNSEVSAQECELLFICSNYVNHILELCNLKSILEVWEALFQVFGLPSCLKRWWICVCLGGSRIVVVWFLTGLNSFFDYFTSCHISQGKSQVLKVFINVCACCLNCYRRRHATKYRFLFKTMKCWNIVTVSTWYFFTEAVSAVLCLWQCWCESLH